MARFDPSRGLLELNDDELGAASALVMVPDAKFLRKRKAREYLDRLEAAGVTVNRELQGNALPIVSVLAEPNIRMMVERFESGGTQRDFAAVKGEYGIWGEPTQNGNEFRLIEPEHIAQAMSDAVGLGPRPEPSLSEPVGLHSSVLQNVLSRLGVGDLAEANAVLEAESMDSEKRKVLIKLLRDRKLSWRASSVWKDGMGADRACVVAVMDGGESGLWISEHFDVASKSPSVRLSPTDPGAVLEQLAEVARWPRGENGDHAA
jgi:hypothetical protein